MAAVPVKLRRAVFERAGSRCEYCQISDADDPVTLHIEHIVARKHGGQTLPGNLAVACGWCNLHKGTNLSGIDPLGSLQVQLFNPRQDRWDDHFGLAPDGSVFGRTPIGRATISVLNMNEARRSRIRASGRR